MPEHGWDNLCRVLLRGRTYRGTVVLVLWRSAVGIDEARPHLDRLDVLEGLRFKEHRRKKR